MRQGPAPTQEIRSDLRKFMSVCAAAFFLLVGGRAGPGDLFADPIDPPGRLGGPGARPSRGRPAERGGHSQRPLLRKQGGPPPAWSCKLDGANRCRAFVEIKVLGVAQTFSGQRCCGEEMAEVPVARRVLWYLQVPQAGERVSSPTSTTRAPRRRAYQRLLGVMGEGDGDVLDDNAIIVTDLGCCV